MIKIGITGGIGSGKSFVAKQMEEKGIPVYYTDDMAKQLMVESPVIHEKLIKLLGEDAYSPDGQPNKKKLIDYLFANKENALRINSIVHPVVKSDFQQWVERHKSTEIVAMMHAAAEKPRERHQISGAHRPGAAGHDLAQDPRVDPGPAGELRRRQLFSRHPRAEDRRSRLKRPHASPPIRPAAGSSSADRCCPPAFHTHASAPGPARASGPTAPAASGSPRRHAGRARR